MAKRELRTIQIPREDAERVQAIAERYGVSRVAVIRWAIRAYAESFVPSSVINSTVETALPQLDEVPA